MGASPHSTLSLSFFLLRRFLLTNRNRTEKSRLHNSDIDIDFETISSHPDDEREAILNAESGMNSDSDDESVHVLTAH